MRTSGTCCLTRRGRSRSTAVWKRWSVESYDVAEGVYTAWDIDGRRIELLVSDTDRYQVEAKITTVDEQREMRAALERWVHETQRRRGGPPGNLSSLSTAELVLQTPELQQPPPSLWQRLRCRGPPRQKAISARRARGDTTGPCRDSCGWIGSAGGL